MLSPKHSIQSAYQFWGTSDEAALQGFQCSVFSVRKIAGWLSVGAADSSGKVLGIDLMLSSRPDVGKEWATAEVTRRCLTLCPGWHDEISLCEVPLLARTKKVVFLTSPKLLFGRKRFMASRCVHRRHHSLSDGCGFIRCGIAKRHSESDDYFAGHGRWVSLTDV